MEYYHDINLIPFQQFPTYDHQRQELQLLSTDQPFRSAHDCEESSHPERGIAGFVSKLYQ
jgi:hypothetical protein